MKPLHESASTVITTPQQRRLIEQLMDKHLEDGGCMLAQVFHDGLRLRVLTPRATRLLLPTLTQALGDPVTPGMRRSAFDKPSEGGAT